MKKKSTFVALTTVLLGLSGSMFAQTYEDFKTLDLYKTDAEITIDGEDNEGIWAAPEVAEQVVDRFGDVNATNTTGCSYKFKAVWDAYYLYVFVKATDRTWIPYDPDQTVKEENVDNIEFYFSTLERKSTDPSTIAGLDGKTESQLRASVGSDSRASGNGLVKTFLENDNTISGYKYFTKQTADGYTMEVQIPWEIVIADDVLDNTIIEDGVVLFDLIGADCTSYESGRDVILQWSTDDYFDWKRNSKYGELHLKGLVSTGIDDHKVIDVKHSFINGMLTLADVDADTEVIVYDLSGRQLEAVKYDGTAINLSYLNSGVYLVEVGNAVGFKIVK